MKWMLGTQSRTAAFWTLFVAVYAGTLLFSVVAARADQASANPFRELVKVVVTSGLFDVGLSRASKADTSAVRAQLEKQLGRPLSQAEGERLQRLVSRVLLEVFPRSFWEDTYVDVLS